MSVGKVKHFKVSDKEYRECCNDQILIVEL